MMAPSYLQGHIWRMRLLAILLRGRISAGTCWPEALAAANLLTPFYRELYPQASLLTGSGHSLSSAVRSHASGSAVAC